MSDVYSFTAFCTVKHEEFGVGVVVAFADFDRKLVVEFEGRQVELYPTEVVRHEV